MKRKTIIAAAAISGCLVAAGALAGMGHGGMRHGPRGENLFDRIDANKDGTVTKAEAAAFTESRMKEFDGNHDGQVTRAEFDAAHQAKMEERQQAFFKKLDANGDGTLSEAEFRSMRAHRGQKGGHDGT